MLFPLFPFHFSLPACEVFTASMAEVKVGEKGMVFMTRHVEFPLIFEMVGWGLLVGLGIGFCAG